MMHYVTVSVDLFAKTATVEPLLIHTGYMANIERPQLATHCLSQHAWREKLLARLYRAAQNIIITLGKDSIISDAAKYCKGFLLYDTFLKIKQFLIITMILIDIFAEQLNIWV